MGEVDQARIELLQPRHPRRRRRERPWVPGSAGCPGQQVGGIVAGGVVTLASHDDRCVRATYDKGLVSVGVPWRRDQEHAREDLDLSVYLLVPAVRNELGSV